MYNPLVQPQGCMAHPALIPELPSLPSRYSLPPDMKPAPGDSVRSTLLPTQLLFCDAENSILTFCLTPVASLPQGITPARRLIFCAIVMIKNHKYGCL
jgi:hypothetical protein